MGGFLTQLPLEKSGIECAILARSSTFAMPTRQHAIFIILMSRSPGSGPREGGEIDARQPRNDPALVSQNCGGHVDVQHARMRVREVALFMSALASRPQSPMDKAGPRLN